MGKTPGLRPLSDAPGRRADRGLAARSALKRFRRDAGGATAIEYALMGSLIAGAIITAVVLLGGKVEDSYTKSSTAISDAIGG